MTKDGGGGAKVQVVVRVRPFNRREKELGAKCVVEMNDTQTTLYNTGKAADEKKSPPKTFTFDRCFWSMDKSEPRFASQEDVYETVGVDLLANAFQGYNACIFAYGQTGSGKSYSMMGSPSEPGLIPRLCQALFERIDRETGDSKSFTVEVSFLEIYNEKVRDLLDPSGATKNNLKIREHSSTGVYVEGLSKLVALSSQKIEEYISDGTKARTVAATKMNAESSRSHAVFTVEMKQTLKDVKTGVAGDRVSKISLVDLAGSERSSKTGATGTRLKEGSNINKSLTTLGLVISLLAEKGKGGKKKRKKDHIPYRDSTLTFILRDNLGGNSRTTMVATISPSQDNYDETLSTLRYADRAKQIVNSAVVNEDENARIVRELQEEVERLKKQLRESQSMAAPDLREKLREREQLQVELTRTWEEKIRMTEEIHKKSQEAFEKMGISVQTSGIKVEKKKCFLVNLNADPQMNELLLYYLKEDTSVGQSESSDLMFHGLGIADNHARITVDSTTNTVMVIPFPNARTCVNGVEIHEETRVRNGDRILWGNNHYFRVNVPKPPKPPQPQLTVTSSNDNNDNAGDNELVTAASNESINDLSIADQTMNETINYDMAKEEVMLNQDQANIDFTIGTLEREFNMLTKSHHHHHGNHDVTNITSSPMIRITDDNLDMTSHGATGNDPMMTSLKQNDNGNGEEMEKYKKEIQSLRQQLSLMSPMSGSMTSLAHSASMPSNLSLNQPNTTAGSGAVGESPAAPSMSHYHPKHDRERAFNQSLESLRKELMQAQALVQEANALSSEMRRETHFAVTLRIPAKNLTPNRPEGALMCEPAIQVVRQGKDLQTWCCDTLSLRLIDMREMYDQFKQIDNHDDQDWLLSTEFNQSNDPFNEIDNRQSVIGVANVFLACLLQDEPLTYPVPIINQHGQVAGKLTVSIQRINKTATTTTTGVDGDPQHGGGEVDEEDGLLISNHQDHISSGGDQSTTSDDDVTSLPNSLRHSCDDVTKPPEVDNDDEEVKIRKKKKKKKENKIVCRIKVLEAQGLMPTLSHFVQCQYTFPGSKEITVVPPNLSPDEISPTHQTSLSVRFDHSADFETVFDDDFVESMQSNYSLAIEVWGHRNRYTSDNKHTQHNNKHTTQQKRRTRSRDAHSSTSSTHSTLHNSTTSHHNQHHSHHFTATQASASNKSSNLSNRHDEIQESLQERWSEVTKRLRLDVQVLELTDSGEYEPVEVEQPRSLNNSSCGCFLLKQGQSRRLEVKVQPIEHSGSLPLLCESVASVLAGSVTQVSINDNKNGLDSYQDKDMQYLADEWLIALERRKEHLTNQINEITKKDAKTALESERENTLFDQWMRLQGELTAAHTGGAGIPGSPNDNWQAPEGVEQHVPLVYLDLNPEEVDNYDIMRTPAGLDSEINGEIAGTFFNLQFVRPPSTSLEGIVSGLVSWDSSIHDTALLNLATPSNRAVYVIIRVHVRLSHPASMDLVLRKRIRVSVYRQKSSSFSLFRKMGSANNRATAYQKSGVIYEIVSSLPMASSEGDDHETLALLAASGANSTAINENNRWESDDELSAGNQLSGDDETGSNQQQPTSGVTSSSFERYVMHASRSVDNILALDRLKQEMALRSVLLQNHRHHQINHRQTADVISVISKRYKNSQQHRASSVYSGYPP